MKIIVLLFLLQITTSNLNNCITKHVTDYYNFETENTVIDRKDDFLVVTFSYSDKKKNIRGEKIITIDMKGKRYQYESYFNVIVVDHNNYTGMADNFGFGKWKNIDFNSGNKNSLILKIYNCENNIKN